VVVAATLDDIRYCPSIDFEVKRNVPAEIRGSDQNQTTTRLNRSFALNAPQRAVGAELGDFTGGAFADVNGDGNHADECADKNQRHEPRRNVPDVQRVVKRYNVGNWRAGVQKDFGQPRNQDQDKNEHVIAFHPAPDRLQLRDLETRQNQIFAHELFPFALKQLAILHDHRDKKMCFEHAEARAERVVKTVSARLDPKQDSNNGQVKKENDVRHFARGKRDCNNGGAAGDGPVCSDVQPLPPHHDPPQFAPIKMRHRIDIARVVNAALQGDCPLLFRGYGCILSCHDSECAKRGTWPTITG
jgi:hypothetical protein